MTVSHAFALPIEIAFLAQHGVPPSALRAAASRAARIGVDPAREVIASGLVSEAGFYRALAAELGLPFHPGELRFRPGGVFGAILREGVAIVAEERAARPFRFALAPAGPALRRMLEAGPRHRPDIAVMTPGAFASALRRANARPLAHRLAGTDDTGRGRLSARDGGSLAQWLVAGASSGTAFASGSLAPFETMIVMACLAWPVFLAVSFLRMSALFAPQPADLWRSHRWRIDDGRLPVYTVAIPLFREERVLPKLIAALSALDYPAAKLDIRLLVEEEDAGLRKALARYVLPPCFSVVVVPDGKPRTKPRALNLALAEARGELFTIFDAEDVPDPQQLRQAAARFLRLPPDVACLQAHLVIDNAGDGWLQKMFALEYAGLFDVVNPGLLRSGLPILLGGTSNHFRTSALRVVGGWDAWNVTEDADIGVRMVRAGYRMADLASGTLEEAPDTLSAWVKQRTRWFKGYVQTAVSHLRRPLALLGEAGWVATLSVLTLSLGTVVAALFYPLFPLTLLVTLILGLTVPETGAGNLLLVMALSVALTGSVAIVAPPALGAIRRGAWELLLWLPLLPVYYLLVSVAAWLALLEYARAPFRWNKTMHGFARSSRYRALTNA